MSAIPDHYEWIIPIRNKPRMIEEALKLVGIKEYTGNANNNPVIMGFAKDLSVPLSIYPNDETAWCALVHSWLCWKTAKPLPGSGKDYYMLVRAKSFLQWGIEVLIPMFGDTLVFKREGGYHVGLYIAEDITHYHVLGGNQKNSYSFMRLEKDRMVGARCFYAKGAPSSVIPRIVSPIGEISNNEI